jgi:hypothetical protein
MSPPYYFSGPSAPIVKHLPQPLTRLRIHLASRVRLSRPRPMGVEIVSIAGWGERPLEGAPAPVAALSGEAGSRGSAWTGDARRSLNSQFPTSSCSTMNRGRPHPPPFRGPGCTPPCLHRVPRAPPSHGPARMASMMEVGM